jgi:hypothetical protein
VFKVIDSTIIPLNHDRLLWRMIHFDPSSVSIEWLSSAQIAGQVDHNCNRGRESAVTNVCLQSSTYRALPSWTMITYAADRWAVINAAWSVGGFIVK